MATGKARPNIAASAVQRRILLAPTGDGSGAYAAPGPAWRLRPVLFLALLWLLGGCSWTVIPPQAVPEPQKIFVNQYGWHTRLALPDPDTGGYLEYGIGDWHYYARGERGMLSGLRALFFSGATALSRRPLPRVGEERTQSRFGSVQSAALEVSGSRVAALRQDLEDTWEANPTPSLEHGGQEFRKIGQRYWLFANSNHQTAQWLRQLGCEVEGMTVFGSFQVSREEEKAAP